MSILETALRAWDVALAHYLLAEEGSYEEGAWKESANVWGTYAAYLFCDVFKLVTC